MKTNIDIATWNRREHFAHFLAMDEPFHGVTTNLDCTWAYQHCKETRTSFFLFYVHKLLCAVNQTAAMRYRLEQGKVYDYARVHGNATIGRDDHTFGFCTLEFEPDFGDFADRARVAMTKVKQASGLCQDAASASNNVVHLSVLPGVSFTGLTHATRFKTDNSIPKLTVGRCFQQGDRWMMPVGTFVHHALVDGYHVQQYLLTLEQLLGGPQ